MTTRSDGAAGRPQHRPRLRRKPLGPRPTAWLLAAAPLTGLLGSCAREDEPTLPPNVIVISLDTLRRDHCGFHGYERETTPFLDELSKECVIFDRAYTTMSWTLIAHMSMLTGLYPSQHRVMESEFALNPTFPTVTQRLEREGWDTVGVHFPGWLDPRYGFDRGFQSYEPAENMELAEERLTESLGAVRSNRPLFMFIHLFDIHSGNLHRPGSTMYEPPAPYDGIFVPDAKARLAGIDAAGWWDNPCDPTPEQHEAIVALYDGGIRYVDDKLKAWFEDWQRRGILDNTLIIITSDHGEGLRQREARYGGHGNLNEEGLRVPLLVRFPGGKGGGRRVDDLVSHVDIVPTILDVTGLEPDERLPGIVLGSEQRRDDEWVFAGRSKIAAAISKKVKLVYRVDELPIVFDLVNDPGEDAPTYPKRATAAQNAEGQKLLDQAHAQLATYHDPGEAIRGGELDAASRDSLRALGYGGEVDPK